MNLSNNKCYIGQSKNVYKRLEGYFYGKNHNWELQHDIRNNINIFKIKIVEYEKKYNGLDNMENDLIIKYNSVNNGYNKKYQKR